MSAIVSARIGAIATGLSCLLLSIAIAADTDPVTGKVIPSQSLDNTTPRAGQNDRAQAPQQGTRRGQPYTANYGAQAGTGQASQEVEHYLANCLLQRNKAEVEISQFAEEQSQNPQVKQFAGQMVKDHQQLVQKLEQIAGNQPTAQRGSSRLDLNAPSGTDRTTLGATGVPATPATPGTETPATPGATSTTETSPEPGATANRGMMSPALSQLAGIEQKIGDHCKQALREELQQKSGAEFDQCYLGAQVGAHMQMLSALEVIAQENTGQLKQIADEARPIVQKHLDKAKDLMKQEKGEPGTARAQRTTPGETQR
jgi:predicted outer membrane protein